MLLCYLFYSLHITYITVYMYRKYCLCIFCYQLFNLLRVHCEIVFFYITKYRLKTVPYYGMCSGSKGKRRCNDFTVYLKRLQCKLKCQMSVHRKYNLHSVHKLAKSLLKPVVYITHICKPCTVPYFIYILNELLLRRQCSLRDKYFFLFHIPP